MSPIDKAIEKAGGPTALAEKLGLKPNRVGNWRTRGVPTEYCARVERATGGAVTRKDFRPLDWHEIWPELARKRQPRSA